MWKLPDMASVFRKQVSLSVLRNLLKRRSAGAFMSAEHGEKGITQKWMWQRGFWPWGIQNGPFAACSPKSAPISNPISKCNAWNSRNLKPINERFPTATTTTQFGFGGTAVTFATALSLHAGRDKIMGQLFFAPFVLTAENRWSKPEAFGIARSLLLWNGRTNLAQTFRIC